MPGASVSRPRKLLPRERVAMLIDPGAPWLELSTLAGLRMHDDDGAEGIQGGGGIAGIGYVSGIRCIVSANDSAIKGGTSTPMGVKKHLRIQEIALENKLPFVRLVESGGANLLYQAEMFVEGGRGFANQARMSAAGIPQVTVVHGSSTAGGAYLPGLSDYVILVRGRAKVFLAGPPLLARRDRRDRNRRRARRRRNARHHFGARRISRGRRCRRHPYRARDHGEAAVERTAFAAPQKSFKEPRYAAEELAGVVPGDYRKPYDVREVIARIVDDSDFLDFKALYGPHTVCGQAEIEGHAVGLIGNNGPIDADGASKAAQFIQLCCQANMPIVYLQNTTGYMVGARSRASRHHQARLQDDPGGGQRHRAADDHSVGASFGAGNYGMCGRAYDPRFIFCLAQQPHRGHGRRAGGEGHGDRHRGKTQARRASRSTRPGSTGWRRRSSSAWTPRSTALYATARLWDDGLIDPRDTRKVLAFVLSHLPRGRRYVRSSPYLRCRAHVKSPAKMERRDKRNANVVHARA